MHYYKSNGDAAHFQPKKDGSGLRPTTIADCRKQNLLPSVTTITALLHKEALLQWMIRNAVQAFATAPDVDGETLDQRITRILEVECQQDEQSRKAREKGEAIHEAIELALTGKAYEKEFIPFVAPVIDQVYKLGRVVYTEKIFVSTAGYAGKSDCGSEDDEAITVIDFKSCSALPRDSYWEHKLQLAAYADCFGNTGEKRIRTANIYISTKNPGEIKTCIQEDWFKAKDAFLALLKYWQLTNL